MPAPQAAPALAGTRTTAAALVIGNELLSGKVQDENTPVLVRTLRELGVCLRRVVILADDMEAIGQEVRACSAAHDHVITSGGVGPTHDDITMVAVARAFGDEVARHPRLEALVRDYFGERVNDAALKLCEIPSGAELLTSSTTMLPVVRFRNIYILPGIPKLFRAKLEALRPLLGGAPCHLASVYLRRDESAVAHLLTRVVDEHPRVEVGSYPRMGDPEVTVRVTVESNDAAAVQRAVDALLDLLPPESVVRVERRE